jgi:hypothetical protein
VSFGHHIQKPKFRSIRQSGNQSLVQRRYDLADIVRIERTEGALLDAEPVPFFPAKIDAQESIQYPGRVNNILPCAHSEHPS